MIHLDLHHWFHLASTSWQRSIQSVHVNVEKNRGATTCLTRLTTTGSSSHLVFLHSTHHVTSCHMFWHRGIYWSVDRKPLTFSCCASVRAGLLTHSWWFVQKSVIFAHSGGSLVAPWHRAKVLTTAWTSNWVWFVRLLFISASQLLIKLGDGLCGWFYHRKFRLIDSIPVYDAIICHQDWFKDDNGKFLISIHLYRFIHEFQWISYSHGAKPSSTPREFLTCCRRSQSTLHLWAVAETPWWDRDHVPATVRTPQRRGRRTQNVARCPRWKWPHWIVDWIVGGSSDLVNMRVVL